ncbi:Twin arginine translocation protein [Cordyceps fumosorosea ARSEF 2679]|uniref:Twin arginine translocation protein n=1 Tax=Cordyceps fumosorosea (strain ARSEF 2679) TaxID=1081104 RepID=A0A167LAT5_CORFA|nr:Twin arginine translocation protein [Cordyceps fumosorosea ARSEF 2679]OAA52857.1 Twin arginine translocation protein [Cordyceps fumosorosea ARSEF 2679]
MIVLARQRLLSRAGPVAASSFPGRRPSLTSIRGAASKPPISPHGASLPPRQRRSTPSSNDSPTGVQLLADELEFFNVRKWGWVIYRCTYGDDAAWERFKERVAQQTRDDLASPCKLAPAASSVVDGVDWKFVSDRALRGASRDALRERFRAWVAGDTSPGPPPAGSSAKSARHSYFVQVDEASLRSVFDGDDTDAWSSGWVNLVRCVQGLDYDKDPRRAAQEEEYRREMEHEGEEYDPEDWIMLSAEDLGPSFYGTLGSRNETWHVFHSKPPNLVKH